MKPTFTVKQGMAIQTRQLREWRGILKPPVYKKLLKRVLEENEHADYKDGYDVFRDSAIDCVVHNLAKLGAATSYPI